VVALIRMAYRLDNNDPRLNQLRADISQGRKKWMKGCGEAKISQIEDALMNWMSRNIDALSGPATEADAAADDHDTLDL
jgi:hypothetical protein